ncbi:hypothetical protein PPTG_05675 [Phytophthora nicotianae INRA-310]|uniref:Uncharacterized protein n=1 Tax=Phytophthora nicotianae (strain INRA-310) TaxID=761204 RepID=W2QTP9_PHYN3|nr:hypothetical protein PPTG_05675 [Phytophthora nicotianae INRA-310]ETN16473.1 hypothetical protein PPTG_05675 [Phytophthora nicotianae INRA-310]
MTARLVWFQFVDREGVTMTRVDYVLETNAVAFFLDAAYSKVKAQCCWIPELIPADLRAFTNEDVRTRQQPLDMEEDLACYGIGTASSVVVEVPKIWIQLVATYSATAFEGTRAAWLPLREECTVEQLKHAVKREYQDSYMKGILVSELGIYKDSTKMPPLAEKQNWDQVVNKRTVQFWCKQSGTGTEAVLAAIDKVMAFNLQASGSCGVFYLPCTGPGESEVHNAFSSRTAAFIGCVDEDVKKKLEQGSVFDFYMEPNLQLYRFIVAALSGEGRFHGQASRIDFSRVKDTLNLIDGHFGCLEDSESFDLYLGWSGLLKGSEKWGYIGRFQRMENDILLYMTLMGDHKLEQSTLRPLHAPVHMVLKDTFFRDGSIINSVTKSNNGPNLETLLAGAVVLASHRGQFGGAKFPEFLGSESQQKRKRSDDNESLSDFLVRTNLQFSDFYRISKNGVLMEFKELMEAKSPSAVASPVKR